MPGAAKHLHHYTHTSFDALTFRRPDGCVRLRPVERPQGRGGHLRLQWALGPGGARLLTVDTLGGSGRWAQFQVSAAAGSAGRAVQLRGVGTGAYLSVRAGALVGTHDSGDAAISILTRRAARSRTNNRREERVEQALRAREYLEHRRLAAAAHIMERRAAGGRRKP